MTCRHKTYFFKATSLFWRVLENIQPKRVKVKEKFTLEQTTKAQRRSRCIALLFFNLGARWGWVVNVTPRPLYLQERPGTHFTGANWAAGPVGAGAENMAHTVIRSPERPARSESLYH
jgi:hypothetical protein